MSDKIKELKEQLAKAEAEEAKKEGVTVVVFDDDLENLKEIKAASHEIAEKDKAEIEQAAIKIGENYEELMDLLKNESNSFSQWLRIMNLIDEPIKKIIAKVFDLNERIVAALPNIRLVDQIMDENPWINSKASNVAKELKFLADKVSDSEEKEEEDKEK